MLFSRQYGVARERILRAKLAVSMMSLSDIPVFILSFIAFSFVHNYLKSNDDHIFSTSNTISFMNSHQTSGFSFESEVDLSRDDLCVAATHISLAGSCRRHRYKLSVP